MITKCCQYLAKVNRVAISKVVVKSVICMEWMQKVTRMLAKAGYPVTWKTPLGLTVTQKNHKQKLKRIKTYWGGVCVFLSLQEDLDTLNAAQMANGIVPNFIHSLDATHLLKTVLLMNEKYGLTNFSMIHDSYGVHAADVDEMHSCIREAFFDMYGHESLLDKFFVDIVAVIDDPELINSLPKPPALGNLDPNEIFTANYFYS